MKHPALPPGTCQLPLLDPKPVLNIHAVAAATANIFPCRRCARPCICLFFSLCPQSRLLLPCTPLSNRPSLTTLSEAASPPFSPPGRRHSFTASLECQLEDGVWTTPLVPGASGPPLGLNKAAEQSPSYRQGNGGGTEQPRHCLRLRQRVVVQECEPRQLPSEPELPPL